MLDIAKNFKDKARNSTQQITKNTKQNLAIALLSTTAALGAFNESANAASFDPGNAECHISEGHEVLSESEAIKQSQAHGLVLIYGKEFSKCNATAWGDFAAKVLDLPFRVYQTDTNDHKDSVKVFIGGKELPDTYDNEIFEFLQDDLKADYAAEVSRYQQKVSFAAPKL